MAEELVYGPSLVLLDEPIIGCTAMETSVVMSAFRELVNKEKTVVTTMFEVRNGCILT